MEITPKTPTAAEKAALLPARANQKLTNPGKVVQDDQKQYTEPPPLFYYEIYSDEMAPIIEPGDFVYMREILTWKKFFIPSKTYLLKMNGGNEIIARVEWAKNNEFVVLKFNNDCYCEHEIPKDTVKQFFLIEKCFKKPYIEYF